MADEDTTSRNEIYELEQALWVGYPRFSDSGARNSGRSGGRVVGTLRYNLRTREMSFEESESLRTRRESGAGYEGRLFSPTIREYRLSQAMAASDAAPLP